MKRIARGNHPDFRINIEYMLIAIIVILFLVLSIMGGTAAKEKTDISSENLAQGRVLFISSYSYSWDMVKYQIEGISEGISEDVTLDFEFMDTKRVETAEASRLFYEGVKYRLTQVEPYDAIILGDDAALMFAMEHREELFPDTPIIYEGVNDLELAQEATMDPLINGIPEIVDVGTNIDWGLTIIPDAQKVAIVLDDSVTSEAIRLQFYQEAANYPELEFVEIDSTQLTTKELKATFQAIDDQTILLYILMGRDGSGRHYTNQEAAKFITEYASIPYICMVEDTVGMGPIGGYVVSMKEAGRMAGSAAMELVKKRQITLSQVPMECPGKFYVDVERLNFFGINSDLIPKDAERINYQPGFWERNKEAIFPLAFIACILIVFMVWVGTDNIRRRHLMQELEETRAIMEKASQHDFLTRIPNRSKFRQDLEKLFMAKIPCTVIMIDIDDFKSINDNLGHRAGDQALQQVAERLMEMKSQILTPYRYAGDEFIIILESNLPYIMVNTAYQCRQVFSKPFTIMGEETKIFGSIGIASFPNDAGDIDQLIVNADNAMYRVKKNGKNDFAFYHLDVE